jgi:hypothetical protein
MIVQLTDFPENVVAFVCKGRVTKADYEGVVVPTVLNALQAQDKVRLYLRRRPTCTAGITCLSRLGWLRCAGLYRRHQRTRARNPPARL